MTVPYSFGAATSAIPLSQLDSNFNTPITLGNTAIQLGNTVTTLNNMTLANVTITSGTANITANVTLNNANAVVYTNSSNVATTTSTFAFDGTNLGIGTSSPGQKLVVAGNIDAVSTANVGSAGSAIYYLGGANAPTDAEFKYNTATRNLTWKTAAAASDMLTLDASGNLGVGTSSPGRRIDAVGGASQDCYVRVLGGSGSTKGGVIVGNNDTGKEYGALFWDNVNNNVVLQQQFSSGSLIFGTNSTERARITSGGYFKASNAGTYGNSTGSYHELWNNVNTPAAILTNAITSGFTDSVLNLSLGYAANTTTSQFIQAYDTSATRFYVRTNGGIGNYQANDVNLSDLREKTDFAPAKSYLDAICSTPVQTFKYIDQTDDEATLGVIAQDLQAVAPELVTESNWGTEEEPKMRLSIYQTDLQYALMKCIQEQQALITQLTERITALEGAK